ncbi:MAG: hypothetical protein P8Y97_11830 [Candidatus Lokiarchaeota archaeon]
MRSTEVIYLGMCLRQESKDESSERDDEDGAWRHYSEWRFGELFYE